MTDRYEEQLPLFSSMYGDPRLFFCCHSCGGQVEDLFPGNVCAVCTDLSVAEMVEFVRARNEGDYPLFWLVDEVAAPVTPPLSLMGETLPPKSDNF